MCEHRAHYFFFLAADFFAGYLTTMLAPDEILHRFTDLQYALTVALDEAMTTGHLALPNGLGVDHPEGEHRVRTGVAPNELTASEDRDPWVGTPWHKSVAARLETV